MVEERVITYTLDKSECALSASSSCPLISDTPSCSELSPTTAATPPEPDSSKLVKANRPWQVMPRPLRPNVEVDGAANEEVMRPSEILVQLRP